MKDAYAYLAVEACRPISMGKAESAGHVRQWLALARSDHLARADPSPSGVAGVEDVEVGATHAFEPSA